MPFEMEKAQSVIIGNTVYIGGGFTTNGRDNCIMKLDLQEDKWATLPHYSTKWFAMTSRKNRLLLVGGCN